MLVWAEGMQVKTCCFVSIILSMKGSALQTGKQFLVIEWNLTFPWRPLEIQMFSCFGFGEKWFWPGLWDHILSHFCVP